MSNPLGRYQNPVSMDTSAKASNSIPTIFSSLSSRQSIALLGLLSPVTAPCFGETGRIIQLWKHSQSLFASVQDGNEVRLISGNRITNAFQPCESSETLLKRIEESGIHEFYLTYIASTVSVIVSPVLIGGVRNQSKTWTKDKIDNVKRNLEYTDLNAAWKESKGQIVKLKENGVPYDHMWEISEAQWCLKKVIIHNKETLKNYPDLHPKERERLGKEISEASKLLDRSEGFLKSSPARNPVRQSFRQLLQQTRLTETYNSTHRNNPVPAKGGTGGEIGGVACSVDYIEGLFDAPESLFEADHFFCLPKLPDGQAPFTDGELRQILRELAIGIYTHSTIPFFSLHFFTDPNLAESSDLFPVIHDAYKNTLVGRVISMLDYIMKGYLWGGTFNEEFIDNWYKNPDWKTRENSALEELIDFKKYCEANLKGTDQEYMSAREMQENVGKIAFMEVLLSRRMNAQQSRILAQFEGFRNSFRIIAGQDNYQKEGNLFIINSDFRVEYTIEPSPEYQEELAAHFRQYGSNPPSYQEMIGIYEWMKVQIHEHLVKFPLCQKYFTMLGVINFFSSYYSTLKMHRKVPVLDAVEREVKKGCPPLFPHLPITSISKEKLRYNPQQVLQNFISKNRQDLDKFFNDLLNDMLAVSSILTPLSGQANQFNSIFDRRINVSPQTFQPDTQKVLIDALSKELENNISGFSSKLLLRFLKANKEENSTIKGLIQNQASAFFKTILSFFESDYTTLKNLPSNRIVMWEKVVGILVPKLHERFKNETLDFSSEFDCNVLCILPDLSKLLVERNRRVVGGCGMELLKNRIEPSRKASAIMHRNFEKIIGLKPESWKIVDTGENTKGGVFRLRIEDSSPYFLDNYSWMESGLFLNKNDPNQQKRREIQLAMSTGNREEFARLLNETSNLKDIRDNHNATLLHYAAGEKDTYYSEALINKGLSPKDLDDNGYHPIHYAAMEGCVEQIEFFLSKDRNTLNAKSKNGSTPLIVSIQHGRVEAVEYLVGKTPKPTVLIGGYTDLHCALHEGNRRIIDLILADSTLLYRSLNICSEEGGTPLMLACELDDPDLVKNLIDKGANASGKRKDGVTPIEIAINKGSIPVLKVLLTRAVPSNLSLVTAFAQGSLELVQLLEPKSDFANFIHSGTDTGLHIALSNANIPVALYLAEKYNWNILKNFDSHSPLNLAMSIGAWDVADILIKKGASPDLKAILRCKYHPFVKKIFESVKLPQEVIQSYLLEAAQAGNYLAISQIFQPMNVNLEQLAGPKGWRIRHYLAKADGLSLIRDLCKSESEILSPLASDGNKTLAYIAAEHRSSRVLRHLLKLMKSKNIQLNNHYNERHLFYAVLGNCHVEDVKMAFEIFSENNLVNFPLDSDGTRSVHIAAKLGSDDILKVLAEKGAEFNVRDKKDRTPLYYAIRSGNETSVAFLLNRGVPAEAKDIYESVVCSQFYGDKILSKILTTNPAKKLLDEALYMGILQYNTPAVLQLLKIGASFDHITPEGWTPTLRASFNGQYDILEIILSVPPLDLRLKEGYSALHLACKQGHAHCVELLLEKGFSSIQPNNKGMTPSNLAANRRDIIEILNKNPRLIKAKNFEFLRLIESKNVERLKEIAKDFSPEERIYIDAFWGSPLQILLQFCKDNGLEELIPLFFQPYQNASASVINSVDSQGNTIAHSIAKFGDSLLRLKSKGLDLSVRNHKGQTPFHFAAKYADKTILESMLKTMSPKEQMAAVNARDCLNRTPVYYAIEENNEENIRVLAEYGADLRHYDMQLNTPLIFGCVKGSLFAVRRLLQMGADINQIGNLERITPLHASIQNEYKEITRLLLSMGARIDITDNDGKHLIHYAAINGDVELFRILVSMGVSFDLRDVKGLQPKHIAAQAGKTAILEAIFQFEKEAINGPLDLNLESASDLDRKRLEILQGATPLHLATISSNTQTVEWLLNHQANPEAKTQADLDVFAYAAEGPSSTAMIGLFDGFRITQNPQSIISAIVRTIRYDNLDAAKKLYARGIPMNTDINHGSTGLHVASTYGAQHCTLWFLESGADPLYVDHSGDNAFELAAENDSVQQFKLLLDYTAVDPDTTYQQGRTLMHRAAKAGNLKHVVALLMRGASLNIADSSGMTPLHVAVRERRLDIIQLLLACGADTSAKTMQGKTPMDVINPGVEQAKVNAEIKMIFDTFHKTVNKNDPQLHTAIKLGNLLAVLLFAEKDQINNKNSEGLTPLHLAVKSGRTDIVMHLLRLGADRTVTDTNGRTPEWYAEKADPAFKNNLINILKTPSGKEEKES